ncbi:hypothetical protein TsFJ059_005010 [Trichoderma semiorbis]|uniref:FAD/NAD(P)-binding domain-containing protein n=1 Tax=Trichoderma semiorbis TaxID=1491008 RepID=A0A9P8HMF9_9HYPO|nr:hypothetical protein TsFJ059_005010 [Trichoderma semiorbis]
MTHTIVVLGAGLAAAPVIRQVMRNTILPSNELRMIVVTPSTHFSWPIAMPRVVVPGQMDFDKVFYPLAPTFSKYPADKFELVLGAADLLDPIGQTINVSLNSGEERVIPYNTLIIATGTTAKDNMPWKLLGTIEQTRRSLQRLQSDIAKAETIVVAGGGLTGTETAGQLGFEYAKTNKKKVYFIYNSDLPLMPPIQQNVRKQAKTELEKMSVVLIPNTTVSKVTASENGIVLELYDKNGATKSLTTQAYVSTTGQAPNTRFVPLDMLDSHNFIKQTTTLQAEGFPNIFVLGDVGNLEGCKAQYAESQALHLIKALPAYLDGKRMPEYQLNTKVFYGITLGRSRATGQMGNMKLFSWFIWYLKGRTFLTESGSLIAAGKKTLTTTFESK